MGKNYANVEITNYKSFHLLGYKKSDTSKGRLSGGLSVYYKQNLMNKISVVESNNYGSISRDVFKFDEDVYICHCYIPPTSYKVCFRNEIDFFDEVEKGIETYGNVGKTFITSDFQSIGYNTQI